MKTQNGFHVNLNQCTGCQACMLACSIENELPFGESWRNVVTFNEPHYSDVPVFHLSMACNHCEDPACLRGCPALAYSKDPETGAVTIDDDKCIGCKYCTWMCPYDAPQFDVQQGTMKKCTFCNDRLHAGLEPACVSGCPTGALGFGSTEVGDRKMGVPGFTETAIGPSIEVVPFASVESTPGNGALPVVPLVPLVGPGTQPTHRTPRSGPAARTLVSPNLGVSKISLRSEWTLYSFTLIAPLLVAWFASATVGGHWVDAFLYVAIGATAMGISTLHLGKKMRAHRAMFNLRRSWLSREIFFFSAFFGMSAGVLLLQRFGLLGTATPWLGLISLVGAMALFSMDMVYVAAATTHSVRSHSASVFLSGMLYTGLLLGWGSLAGAVGAVKAVAYITRKMAIRRRLESAVGEERTVNGVASSIRLGVGLLLPFLIWIAMGPGAVVWVLVCFVIGELIDRGEFYEEVEIITPRRQMQYDLESNTL